MLTGIEFDRERLEAASGDEMLAATEIADLLVRSGVPFREAHGIVGGLVRDAVEGGKSLSELTPEELRERSEHLDDSYYEVLERSSWLESKRIEGGTGSAPLARQIELARETLEAVQARVAEEQGMSAATPAAGRRLEAGFFERSVHEVARELIGCRLLYEGCGGTIVETESYERDDPACHAFVGLTPRTATLFGPPGRAYVYLSYGIHSLLNFVAEPEGEAAAVLIRALEPTAGLEQMRARAAAAAPRRRPLLGPGQADRGARHRARRQRRRPLPRAVPAPAARADGGRPEVVTGPRIGITKAVERPWRFCAAGSPFVSRPRPAASRR